VSLSIKPVVSKTHIIGFNRPRLAGNELSYIQQALENGHLSGDGAFTKRCHEWLEHHVGSPCALLTHSCTGALEMAALLCGLVPGDEVIMPSYTFVSTANAVALRGGVPVFIDIRGDTLNLDETLIDAAITERTKAIFAVHYAGVACEMDTIMAIAKRHELFLVEDAAQALMSTYRGRPLGSFGHLAAFSFHETKNFISGEGGALVINDPRFIERAEILREKGTNRSRFFRGQVDKYTWVDIGSSYLPSDIIAAFLLAQLERAENLLSARRAVWRRYHEGFSDLQRAGFVRRPTIPVECEGNAHLYYLLINDLPTRARLIKYLETLGIQAPFHYIPLHSAPAGVRFGRTNGQLAVTDDLSGRLLRLPIWPGMTDEPEIVIEAVKQFFSDVAETAVSRRSMHAAAARH
jgi:dTDP-4-amino-4,6-dideoxygalactose transaminase